jgi:hypothetical protein
MVNILMALPPKGTQYYVDRAEKQVNLARLQDAKAKYKINCISTSY